MTSSQVITLVGIILVTDLVIVPMIVAAMLSATWGKLHRTFPGTPLAPDAVRREFQSLSMDSCSFGFCVHVVADADRLHLLPAKFIRWFGAKPISVPWDRIQWIGRSKIPFARNTVKVKIEGIVVAGPAWALGMADVDAERPPAE